MDRAAALQALPGTYALALRLRDEGVESDAMARVLDVEPEAIGPLLTLAEAKLAGLMERGGDQLEPNVHRGAFVRTHTGRGAPARPTARRRRGGR